MNLRERIILLFFYTILFSFLIFIAKNYFFWWKQDYINTIAEEKFIEPIKNEPIIEVDKTESLNSASIIRYIFVPTMFWTENKVLSYKNSLNTFLNSKFIQSKISLLEVVFYKDIWEVRWKMKNKKIRLYGIYNLDIKEFIAVAIHEFSHFYDLYILEKKVLLDVSDIFYDISWETTTVMKESMDEKSFVSWYAMTNKYEDFSETYTYYVLHNSDFYSKSLNSPVLMEKYNFFRKFVFTNEEFITGEFKNNLEIEDYYRDTTKIDFSLEKFLQYLKK